MPMLLAVVRNAGDGGTGNTLAWRLTKHSGSQET